MHQPQFPSPKRGRPAFTKVTAFATFLGAALAAGGCQPRKFNSGVKSGAAATSQAGERKACVGIQGNGVRFPSHLGTFAALLESDITPVVTMGGSSGSIIGSIAMGLLQNTSYDDEAISVDGKTLSRTQKAGLVLAATPDVVNSFIFLPSVNAMWQTVIDTVKFGLGFSYGKALLGDSDMRIASTEAIVGQSALMVDFFTNQDFSSVVALPNYAARRAEVFRLWKEFSNAQTVSVRQIIDAVNGKLSAEDEARFDGLDKRLYTFFQRDVAENDEAITFSWRLAFKAIDVALMAAAKSALPKKLDEIVLTVPDPKLLWNAYLSRTKEGKFMPIPKGMIIHSTFRRGKFELKDVFITSHRGEEKVSEVHTRVEFAEAVGPEKLFQGYVADDHPELPLFSQLRDARRSQEKEGKGFQPYFQSDGTLAYAYPVSQILVLPTVRDTAAGDFNAIKLPNEGQRLLKDELRGVAHGIAYSAGEPGPFSRTMLSIGSQERNANVAGGKDVFAGIDSIKRNVRGEGIISFGGWSENVPLSTLALLPACADAKLFVSGAKEGLGNDFQVAAVRAALKGWTSVTRKFRDHFRSVVTGKPVVVDDAVARHFAAINGNVTFAREAIGERWLNSPSEKPQFLWNRLQFDAPSRASVGGEELKALNGKLTNDRFALLIVSYQKMKEDLQKNAPNIVGPSNIAFGSHILKKSTTGKPEDGDLLEEMTTVPQIEAMLQRIQ
ncbi:MAG: hypothetical protein IOD12_04510 [Silvanigrellales bacterium]|jgi:hypothetical protein|nr:hypothetical protein [Silvanigrellales bacterium]